MDEKIKRLRLALDKNSRNNRAFYDALIRLIWCEIRLPIGHPARSHGDEWADIMLPWWHQFEKDLTATPCEKLTRQQIRFLTGWMASRTANYDFFKGMEIMRELFNDCQLCALNSTASALQATKKQAI